MCSIAPVACFAGRGGGSGSLFVRRFAGHVEGHVVQRIAWLRAAVLGANDGIVSTASLVLGVAAASASRGEIATAGFAGLVAGAMSMAAGEYVSVSSQSDAEAAELLREGIELKEDPASELAELTSIYVSRGLDDALAREVAEQLTMRDALAAHARDELHLSSATAARPILAATTSAMTFAAGAALPLGMALMTPLSSLALTVSGASLCSLACLGAISARMGRAPIMAAVLRVTFWGAAAMALTAAAGSLFGAIV